MATKTEVISKDEIDTLMLLVYYSGIDNYGSELFDSALNDWRKLTGFNSYDYEDLLIAEGAIL